MKDPNLQAKRNLFNALFFTFSELVEDPDVSFVAHENLHFASLKDTIHPSVKGLSTLARNRGRHIHNLFPISSPVTNAMEEVYATAGMVKINEHAMLNGISMYFPNGLKGDNTGWIKDKKGFPKRCIGTEISCNHKVLNKSCVIVGDFSAHALKWENGCTSVTCIVL